jgi:hypothetical protein
LPFASTAGSGTGKAAGNEVKFPSPGMVGSNVVVDGDVGEVVSEDGLCVGVDFDKLSGLDAPDLFCCPSEATDALE